MTHICHINYWSYYSNAAENAEALPAKGGQYAPRSCVT